MKRLSTKLDRRYPFYTLKRSTAMVKPVSESSIADIGGFGSLANPQISIEQRNTGDNAPLNVGNVDVGTASSGIAPTVPEIGKGGIVDITV